MSRRGAAVLLGLAALSLVAGAWQEFTIGLQYHFADAGYFLQAGARLAAGEMPYRDFIFLYPPLTPLLAALSFRVFGATMWAGKLPLALFAAASLPLTYRWLRYAVPRAAAVAGALVVWAAAPVLLRTSYANSFTLAPALVVLIQSARMRPGRVIGPSCWAGLACGVAFGLKHNVGLLLALAVWVRLLCVTPYTELFPDAPPRTQSRGADVLRLCATVACLAALVILRSQFNVDWRTPVVYLLPAAALTGIGAWRAWRRDRESAASSAWAPLALSCGVFAIGAGLVVLPWVIWLARADALRPFLEFSLILRRADGADWGTYYAALFQRLHAITPATLALAAAATVLWIGGKRAGRAAAIVAVLACVAAFEVEGARGMAGARLLTYSPVGLLLALGLAGREDERSRRLYIMAASAAWYVVLGFPAATVNYVVVAAAPALALGVAWMWARTGAAARAQRLALVVLVAAVFLRGWAEWWGAAFTRTPDGLRVGVRWVPGPHGETLMPAAMAAQLERTRRTINVLAPPNAPLVAWPSLSLVNFYTGRRNPTLMDYYWPGFLDEALERRVLGQLRAAAPPVAVMNVGERMVFQDALFASTQPTLHAYLVQRYTLAERIGDWAVLARRQDQPRP